MSDLRVLKEQIVTAAAAAQARLAALRAEIAERRRAITAIATALPPREELIAQAERLIDETAARWWGEWQHALLTGLAGTRVDPMLASRESTPPRRPTLLFADREAPPFGFFCAADPAGVKRLFREMLARQQFQTGLPAEERAEVLARLTDELRAIEATEEAAVDELVAAGVQVAHRPDVVERRQQEARQRELRERAEAERAARQAAIDQAHAARTRSATSPYLGGGR